MKNINKDAEIGRKKISSKREMKGYELKTLLTEIEENKKKTDSLVCALDKAYLAGFAQGYKQAKTESRKATK